MCTLFLLTYLGLGISVLLLPDRLRPYTLLIAPYLGYSLLVLVCSWLVAFGSNVGVSLGIAAIISTSANLWAIRQSGTRQHITRYRGGLLLLLMLTLPIYAISAASMAHNGSLAYVGGEFDIYLLIPLAEWLKSHSAPLFSFATFPPIAPNWNASLPPIGDWFNSSPGLGYAGHRTDDTNFLFQRGPRYLDASLGILLQWDAGLVFRPVQAVILSLCAPSVYLFCRALVGTSRRVAILASLLVAVNGTLFSWITQGHPGQAVGTALIPIALALTLSDMSYSRMGKRALLPAALVLSGLIVSYYQAAPLVLCLLAAAVSREFASGKTRLPALVYLLLLGAITLGLTAPEQIRLILVLLNGTLAHTSGLGDSTYPSIGEAFGTVLQKDVFDLVAGRGQLPSWMTTTMGYAFDAATVISLLLAAVGISVGRASGIASFRLLCLGTGILLAYLRLTDYPYGYAKAQATCTFLLVSALAIGIGELWTRFGLSTPKSEGHNHTLPPFRLVPLGALVCLVLAAAAVNLTVAAYTYWKPVGNIWNPRLWKEYTIGASIPAAANVQLSSAILQDPEATWLTTYFLRNQHILGPYAMQWADSKTRLAPVADANATGNNRPEYFVLGASEIESALGHLPSDSVWAGGMLKAYRQSSDVVSQAETASSQESKAAVLPGRLPIALQPKQRFTDSASAQPSRRLLAVFAAESRTEVTVDTGFARTTFPVEAGVSVRSVAVSNLDDLRVESVGPQQPVLLSASLRDDGESSDIATEYPLAIAVAGQSKANGNILSLRFAYLDRGVPASHSLEVFTLTGSQQMAWIELPTNPDDRIKEIQVNLDGSSMQHVLHENGLAVSRNSSTRPATDGDYVAYFTTSYGAAKPSRIPIYRYSVSDGNVSSFQSYPLVAVWDGRSELSNWH